MSEFPILGKLSIYHFKIAWLNQLYIVHVYLRLIISLCNCSSLKNLVKDFQDLAEICLLLLHLEVRVHCFYFLLPVAKQVSESQWYNVLPVLFLQIKLLLSSSVILYFMSFCIILIKLYASIVLFQSNYAGPIDDLDPDSNVLKLNKDLTSMEEVLQQSLQPKKFK